MAFVPTVSLRLEPLFELWKQYERKRNHRQYRRLWWDDHYPATGARSHPCNGSYGFQYAS
jgi:hypothetical protein